MIMLQKTILIINSLQNKKLQERKILYTELLEILFKKIQIQNKLHLKLKTKVNVVKNTASVNEKCLPFFYRKLK